MTVTIELMNISNKSVRHRRNISATLLRVRLPSGLSLLVGVTVYLRPGKIPHLSDLFVPTMTKLVMSLCFGPQLKVLPA